jgi:hypothetical protein
MRFEWRVHRLLRAEGVLEYLLGGGERLVDIAAPELKVECDVGVAPSGEVLQIGKRAGRLQLVVHEHLRGQRLDLVVNRWHALVIDGDRLRRLFGDARIGREHRRDRFADMPHLPFRKDRLIVKRRTVIGLGNDAADLGGGDDAVHPRHGRRRARLDMADPAMRHGAAADLGPQHAGQAQIVGVFGRAGDLGAGFDPRDRAADLAGRDARHFAHCGIPSTARRSARCKCTSISTRL